MTATVKPIPEGYYTLTPYLVVSDGEKELEFLRKAFDAVLMDRHDTPAGRLAHASLRIGDSMIMMGEAGGEWKALECALYVYVPDVDATYRQAVAAGGVSQREPVDQFYGDRQAGVVDPCGNQWWLATHIEDVSKEEMARRMATAQA